MLTRTTKEASRQCWSTPPELVRVLERRWVPGGFTVDAAAAVETAQCGTWWGPGSRYGEDGLAESWAGQRVWCNPPYGDILPWVRKASTLDAEVAVLLLPVRASSDWWQIALRWAIAIDWIRGRVNFVPPPGVQASSNAEATAAFVFRPELAVASRQGQLVIR